MKKKLLALLLCSVTAVMLAACGSSNEGSTSNTENSSKEKVYLNDAQIQQLFTDADQFADKYVKLGGVLQLNPEPDSDSSMVLQIAHDPVNQEQVFVAYIDDTDSSLKSGDYVKIEGQVHGELAYENMFGGDSSCPLIKNASVTKSTYIDVVAPTTATLEPNVSSEQHNVTVSVDKVEYSDVETRVYMTIKNDSSEDVDAGVYDIKIIMDGQQVGIDNNSQSSYEGNYPELNSHIAANASTSGILVFPTIEQHKDFQISVPDVYSSNYELEFDTYTLNISAQ